jgi:IS4 transposase
MELLASEIALLYKNRWQVVELFFKWIKQHLKIKSFWGTSENAVRIQVYSAIIAFCLVVIAGRELKSNVSVRGTASKLYLGLSVTFVKA